MSRTRRNNRTRYFWFSSKKAFVDRNAEWFSQGVREFKDHTGNRHYFDTIEDVRAFAENEWEVYMRDGGLDEGSSRKGFKRDAKKILRRKSRWIERQARRGKYDDLDLATRKDGKSAIWSWW